MKAKISSAHGTFIVLSDGRTRKGLACRRRHRLFGTFHPRSLLASDNTLTNAVMRTLAYRLSRQTNALSKYRHFLGPSVQAPASIQSRLLHASAIMTSPAKRKAEKDISPPKSKKPKVVVPAYHLTPSRQDESGEAVWPAREEQIVRARDIIKEWYRTLRP
jgi:hypothetical protein